MPTQRLSDCQIAMLVKEVKHHPILYDPKCVEHKDAQNIFNTWESIHAIIITAGDFGRDVEHTHDGRYCLASYKL